MKLLKISHKKRECIGCALCTEVAPSYFELDESGEAQLLQVSHKDKDFQYGSGFPEDFACLKAAAKGCPVDIIRIDR